MNLFTSFEGRISRKSFWLGLVGIIVLSIFVSWALLPLATSGGLIVRVVLFLVSLVLLYPISALIVKRLHDRNKPAMPWAVIFVAPGLVANFLSVFRIGYSTVELAGHQIPVPGMLAYGVSVLAMLAGLWMLIELGCLRGNSGNNSYGNDPLGTPTTVAAE